MEVGRWGVDVHLGHLGQIDHDNPATRRAVDEKVPRKGETRHVLWRVLCLGEDAGGAVVIVAVLGEGVEVDAPLREHRDVIGRELDGFNGTQVLSLPEKEAARAWKVRECWGGWRYGRCGEQGHLAP